MTSTSPEFLPAGEDLSAAPKKNITRSCVYELCVYVRVHGCCVEADLGGVGLCSEILTVQGSGQ